MVPPAAGTAMSEHLAPPSVNDDEWAATARPADGAAPGPAEAANGMAAADNTASPISNVRRIEDSPFGTNCTPYAGMTAKTGVAFASTSGQSGPSWVNSVRLGRLLHQL